MEQVALSGGQSGSECVEYSNEHLITIFPKLEQFDSKTKELFKKAIYKMPMPYLTGMTLQRYPSK